MSNGTGSREDGRSCSLGSTRDQEVAEALRLTLSVYALAAGMRKVPALIMAWTRYKDVWLALFCRRDRCSRRQ